MEGGMEWSTSNELIPEDNPITEFTSLLISSSHMAPRQGIKEHT